MICRLLILREYHKSLPTWRAMLTLSFWKAWFQVLTEISYGRATTIAPIKGTRRIIEISSNGRKYWLRVAISCGHAVRLRHRTGDDAYVGPWYRDKPLCSIQM